MNVSDIIDPTRTTHSFLLRAQTLTFRASRYMDYVIHPLYYCAARHRYYCLALCLLYTSILETLNQDGQLTYVSSPSNLSSHTYFPEHYSRTTTKT